MTLSELYLEAARVAKMEEAYPNIYLIKHRTNFYNVGCLTNGIFNWLPHIAEIEFALAIVEGKPVFKGDELYCQISERKFKVDGLANNGMGLFYKTMYQGRICTSIDSCSWNPPKPKTVMVELLVEDAEHSAQGINYNSAIAVRCAEACRKALEKLK